MCSERQEYLIDISLKLDMNAALYKAKYCKGNRRVARWTLKIKNWGPADQVDVRKRVWT